MTTVPGYAPQQAGYAPQQGWAESMFRMSPELARTMSSGPLNGVPPSPGFWKALMTAQAAIKEVKKTEQTDEKAKVRWKFSRTEDWMAQTREVALHAAGLVVTQSGCKLTAPEVPAPGMVTHDFVTVTFELVCVADGTGRWYSLDWPLWGDPRGGSPDMMNRAALTLSVKYFLRGLLMVPQTDGEADEVERADPHVKDGAYQQTPAPGVVPVRPYAPPQQPFNPMATQAPWIPQQNPPPSHETASTAWGQQQNIPPRQQQQGYGPTPQQGYGTGWQQAPTQQEHQQGYMGAAPVHGYRQDQPQQDPRWQQQVTQAHQGWQPPVPVTQDPIVQQAQQMLQAMPANFPSEPNPTPPAYSAPADGGADPGPPELLAQNWPEAFVMRVCSMRPDEVCPDMLKEQFLNEVNRRFGQAPEQSLVGWSGTGFTPGVDPATGKKLQPKVVQIRRYMKNTNLSAVTAGA